MKELLKRLIRTAPTSDNGELDAAKVLADFFRQNAITAELDELAGNRANVIASIGTESPDAPALIFGAHLDVVPANPKHWSTDPFNPVEKEGKVYGRGAVDMLGGLCAAAMALAEMSQQPLKNRVIFAATAGEETDSCGVKQFVNKYATEIKNPIGVIITEPTGMEIMRAHRGILWLKIQTIGKTAHGSMPHLGVNAVLKMNTLLNQLAGWQIPHTPHPLLGGCSISPNRISGGSATNIVPDTCCLELDIRTLPGQNHSDIIQALQQLCEEIKKDDPDFQTVISIIREVEAMETPGDCEFVKTVCSATGIDRTTAAGFTTDGPHFAELKTPVLIFGPGDGSLCHKPDEFVEIKAIETAKEMYKNIISTIL